MHGDPDDDPYAPESSLPAVASDEEAETGATSTMPQPQRLSEVQLGPSLIFGGGRNFLSKYADTGVGSAAASSSEGPRQRKPHSYEAIAPQPPDKLNKQVNAYLVQSKTMDRILQVVEMRIESFNAVNSITALHRLATVATTSKKTKLKLDLRFKRLVARLMQQLTDPNVYLKPQDLSNVAWSTTRLHLTNSVLFDRLTKHIVSSIGDFEPVNLSMTLWALAKANHIDARVFSAAVIEVGRQLSHFQPQQIANTIWALAKAGYTDADLFDRAAEHAISTIDEFQPMNSSMLLFSFALAKIRHQRLFDEVGDRLTESDFESAAVPHVVTNLAWAYAEAGIFHNGVFEAMAAAAALHLRDFRTQQIATLARAFASADMACPNLFKVMDKVIAMRLAEFSNCDLEQILAAYEKLGMSTNRIYAEERREMRVGRGVSTPLMTMVYAVFAFLLIFVLVIFAPWR